jgi:hypothetical protein
MRPNEEAPRAANAGGLENDQSDVTDSTPQTGECQVSAEHLKQLRDGSGLSPEVIQERGYRTVTRRAELRDYGFSTAQCRAAPGLLIPQCGTDGGNGLYLFRPDTPRVLYDRHRDKSRIVKYEMPAGAGVRLDCPPRCREALADPSVPLWITEGSKKADAGASNGLCVISLSGVWGFKGKNALGGVTILSDWDHVALKGRTVRIVFDSDVTAKPEVKQALERLTEFLQRKGTRVDVVYLPPGEGGQKVGLDDYLLRHSVEDLEALVSAPRPAAKAAPPLLELLDHAPTTISRPLSLHDGKAYAAIWPYVRVTTGESVNRQGEIVRHDPPLESEEQRLMIVRGDGVLFGDGRSNLKEVDATIRLPEIPAPGKLWSTQGVKRWLGGHRPSPGEVFDRIADVVDRFIDFDKSLADQRKMCELIACYILATWFLAAFTVTGYLWPNGERGSGKTQLLVLLAELGYLGQFILAGGSFASLRDLADYGALLCFDDAENLSDPKKTDPDKRTLLLAGNRRGSTVTLKEPSPDGAWRTRHVDTFCPRAFSAIRLPDGVLASRTITIPLVRSGDRHRANADPLEYDLWPHDRRELIDDLWALALTHLPELPAYERRVNAEAELTGRNLEPWRAILAVALWLDEKGVSGLSGRMQNLSVGYQKERTEFESSDLTRLVVSAVSAILAVPAVLKPTPLATEQITTKARELAEEDETGVDPETINNRRVGWVLKRLRLEKAGREEGKKGRQWLIDPKDVERWRSAYSIVDSEKRHPAPENGENGENGGTAEGEADYA